MDDQQDSSGRDWPCPECRRRNFPEARSGCEGQLSVSKVLKGAEISMTAKLEK